MANAGQWLAEHTGGVGRALSNRNYRIYQTGNAGSLIGTWVQRIAVGWLAWELTKSPTWLGVVVAAELAPAILLGPVGGAVADSISLHSGHRWQRGDWLRRCLTIHPQ